MSGLLSSAIYNIFAELEDDTEIASADEVIKTIGHASPETEVEGGRRVDDMVVENVMSGGDTSAKDIFGQIYEAGTNTDTNIFDEIYEHRDELLGGDSDSSSESSDEPEEDSDDDIDIDEAVEGDSDDDDDDNDEHMDRYLKIIKELKAPTAIRGGAVKPARRVRIVNAFPYLMKVAPDHQ